MMRDTLFATLLTLIGVVLGIKAVYGGIRLDWPETILVVGVVLVTVGTLKLFQTIEGGQNNEF